MNGCFIFLLDLTFAFILFHHRVSEASVWFYAYFEKDCVLYIMSAPLTHASDPSGEIASGC